MNMDPRYCTIINGKEYPNWTLKSIDESSEWDIKMRACWYKVCEMYRELRKNPEAWIGLIKNPEHKNNWTHKGDVVYFTKYVSDDFFYSKCNSITNLDEKAKAPLSDFTNRQIIEALYNSAFDRLIPLTDEGRREYIKNYPIRGA